MTFPDAVRTGLTKFFTFEGRASRSEYWQYELFLIIVMAVLIMASSAVFSLLPEQPKIVATGYWLIQGVFVVSSWSSAIRRLHDRNRSAWHVLWIFLPLAGGIILLIWWCSKGVPGPNRYGPDPLEARS
jgi:uncharacterized membrane protein YhaH (DUF805 family)